QNTRVTSCGRRGLSGFGVIALLALSPLTAHAQGWVPTDIGTLGGAVYSEARASNNRDWVVGQFNNVGGHTQACVWMGPGGLFDPGKLGGNEAHAYGVNDVGQVVGSSNISGNAAVHAFIWTLGGAMQDLGTLGGTRSDATGINNLGQVVGSSQTASGTT